MKRWLAIAVLLAAAGMTTAAACNGGRDRSAGVVPSAPSTATGTPAPYGCEVPDMGPVDASSVLRPGPSNGLPRSDARGEPLLLDAVVLDAACRPASSASLDVWHTDARGLYGPKGTERCCYHQGTVRTDANGRFRLETIRPAAYAENNPPPAHIHFEITHAGAVLETEIVFGTGPAPDRAPPTGPVIPVTLAGDAGGWRGEVAFVLGP